jgi:hypothetical protein
MACCARALQPEAPDCEDASILLLTRRIRKGTDRIALIYDKALSLFGFIFRPENQMGEYRFVKEKFLSIPNRQADPTLLPLKPASSEVSGLRPPHPNPLGEMAGR